MTKAISFFSILIALSLAGSLRASTWEQVTPATNPPARSYLAMTYDHASKKIVLFGGFSGSGYLNDTWTFDGTTWTNVTSATAPSPRSNAQMAYDLRSRKVVLFGGYDGRKDLGDTWLWDGVTSTWTQATPAHSPKAVTGPSVFTDLNGRVDVFGGFDGSLYQLTMYQWSGRDWNRLDPPMVPYARSGAAVGVNRLIQQIVLFGGLGDVNPNNTWTYNGVTWTMESPLNQPPLVYSGTAAFDPNLGSVLLFGGGNGGNGEDTTWSWDGSNWTQLFPVMSAGSREGAGMAYDPAIGRTVLFGGQRASLPLNDTWEFLP